MNGDVVSVAASESLSRHVYRLSVVGFLQPEQLFFAGVPLRTAPCSRAAWGSAHFLAMRRPTSSAGIRHALQIVQRHAYMHTCAWCHYNALGRPLRTPSPAPSVLVD